MREERKGISEVISSLLILLIAVALGVGLFTYSIGVFATSQDSFRFKTTEGMARSGERA